jgi:Bacterial regulatory proteins, luxR family
MSLKCSIFSDTNFGNRLIETLAKDARITTIDWKLFESTKEFPQCLDLAIFDFQQPDRMLVFMESIARSFPDAFSISILKSDELLTGLFYRTIDEMSDVMLGESIADVLEYVDLLCGRRFYQVRRLTVAARFDSFELQVLRQIQLGRTNEAIARELNISLSTVKRRVGELTEKLGCESRSEIPVRSIRVVGDLSEC